MNPNFPDGLLELIGYISPEGYSLFPSMSFLIGSAVTG
jgi:hypothetical protein